MIKCLTLFTSIVSILFGVPYNSSVNDNKLLNHTNYYGNEQYKNEYYFYFDDSLKTFQKNLNQKPRENVYTEKKVYSYSIYGCNNNYYYNSNSYCKFSLSLSNTFYSSASDIANNISFDNEVNFNAKYYGDKVWTNITPVNASVSLGYIIYVKCDLNQSTIINSISMGENSQSPSNFYKEWTSTGNTVSYLDNINNIRYFRIYLNEYTSYSYCYLSFGFYNNPIQQYNITYDLSNCTCSPQPTTITDSDLPLSLTLSGTTGYNIPNSVGVSGATSSYNSSTGVLTISAVSGNVTIGASGVAILYGVNYDLINVTSSNTSSGVSYGSTYTTTLAANTGYTLNSANVSVTDVGGNALNYTYSNGNLEVVNITGAIVIHATAIIITYNITYNLSYCTSNNNTLVVNYGDSYSATFIADTGYEFQLGTFVTYTGNATTTAISYNSITFSHIYSDITISCSAVLQTFNITYQLTGCSLSSTPSTLSYGYHYTGVVSADTGYTNNFVLTMTGEYSNMTFTSATLEFDCYGDVIINITATTLQPNYVRVNYSLNGVNSSNTDSAVLIGSTYTTTLTPQSGYGPVSNVIVNNASYSYNSNNGELSIFNITTDFTISASAVFIGTSYSFTPIYNGVTNSSNWSMIVYSSTILDGNLTANEGYSLPTLNDIVYTNLTIIDYNATNGYIKIGNFTGNATIVITGVVDTYSITFNVSHLSTSQNANTISSNVIYTGTFGVTNGYIYPESIEVINANLLSYDSTTGIFKLNNPTGDVIVYANAIYSGGYVVYFNDNSYGSWDISSYSGVSYLKLVNINDTFKVALYDLDDNLLGYSSLILDSSYYFENIFVNNESVNENVLYFVDENTNVYPNSILKDTPIGLFAGINNVMRNVISMPFRFINEGLNIEVFGGTGYAFVIGSVVITLIVLGIVIYLIRRFL